MTIPLSTFRTLDESLAKTLGKSWTQQYAPIVQSIAVALDKGDKAAVEEEISKFDLVKVFNKHRKAAEMIGVASVFFGASRIEQNIDSISFSKSSVPSQVRASVSQLEKMMQELTEQVRKTAHRLVEESERREVEDSQQITKADRLRGFVSFAKKGIGQAGFSGIQISSSLHTSRLASWGFTTEARLKGISYYQVTEQLDGRTCPVCQTMHGKVFPVTSAHTRLDTMLKEKDVSQLKVLAPWPKQDRASLKTLRGLSGDELISNGWDTPPYHPLCRGVLIGVSDVPVSMVIRDDAQGRQFPLAKVEKKGVALARDDVFTFEEEGLKFFARRDNDQDNELAFFAAAKALGIDDQVPEPKKVNGLHEGTEIAVIASSILAGSALLASLSNQEAKETLQAVDKEDKERLVYGQYLLGVWDRTASTHMIDRNRNLKSIDHASAFSFRSPSLDKNILVTDGFESDQTTLNKSLIRQSVDVEDELTTLVSDKFTLEPNASHRVTALQKRAQHLRDLADMESPTVADLMQLGK